MGIICSKCGFEIDEGYKFCPNCGSKVTQEESSKERYKFCPKCASKISADAKICPICGINFDGKFRQIANKYSDNKSINKILDLGASMTMNSNIFNSNTLIKIGWEDEDPAFLHVYNSIAEDYLKKLFILERETVVVGDSNIIVAPVKRSPTSDLSFEDGVKFYENLLQKTIEDLNEAKQTGNFNKEEYYRKKYKESKIELFSNYPL